MCVCVCEREREKERERVNHLLDKFLGVTPKFFEELSCLFVILFVCLWAVTLRDSHLSFQFPSFLFLFMYTCLWVGVIMSNHKLSTANKSVYTFLSNKWNRVDKKLSWFITEEQIWSMNMIVTIVISNIYEIDCNSKKMLQNRFDS